MKKSELKKLIKEEYNNTFDRFTMKVNQEGDFPYQGTLKRSKKGWQLYDIKGSPEETEPFKYIEDIMSYYNITPDQLTGEYTKNLQHLKKESLDTVGSDILKKITGENPTNTSSKNTFRSPSYISSINGGPSVTTIDKYYTLEDYIEEFKSKYGEEPTFDKSGKQWGKILWKPTNPKFLERQKTSDNAVKNFGTKGD